ncbi:MAG: hypothetical protein AAF529_18055 [Pseudomonadota bacterium]
MFSNNQSGSLVTSILPPSVMTKLTAEYAQNQPGAAMLWRARGSLIHEQWLKRWLPPVSPAKSMMQMVLPRSEAKAMVDWIAREANLDNQAVGAVFCTNSDNFFFGADFARPAQPPKVDIQPEATQKEQLHAIYCIVSTKQSDRVCKAAIDAGAHGPIVHFSEGRGLRDRLGWLRITKEQYKEVLMVLCDEDSLDRTFNAMARAGEVHLPGRGFMYQTDVEHGIFNFPSRAAPTHHEASLQQIVAAIDSLQGHQHWRDTSVFQVGGQGQAIGVQANPKFVTKPNQHRLYAMVAAEQLTPFVDLLLENGAPGLNFTRGRKLGDKLGGLTDESQLNAEYAIVRSIADEETSLRLAEVIEQSSAAAGVGDICVTINPVNKVATYIPGRVDYRRSA